MFHPIQRLVLGLVACLALSNTWAQVELLQGSPASPFDGPVEEEFLPVEEAYILEVEPAGDGLRLYWQIADGYYLYQHRFKFALETDSGPVPVDVSLPAGLDVDLRWLRRHGLAVLLLQHSADGSTQPAAAARVPEGDGLCFDGRALAT